MSDSDAYRIASGSPRSRTSSSCRSMSSRRIPRRRWLGRTPTQVTPAAFAAPPGVVSSNGNDAATPTGRSPSQAARTRSSGITLRCRSRSSSLISSPNAAYVVRRTLANSSPVGMRYSRVTRSPKLRDLLERRVLDHEPPLAAVLGEANRDDAAGLDGGHDALPERRVAHGVAGREDEIRVATRRERHGARRRPVARPQRRPQPLTLDLVRELVEEARGEVVAPPPPERARHRVREGQPLHRPRHADVREPALLFDPLLLHRADMREDPLFHPDCEHRAELEALRVVQGHQRDETAVVADRVLVGDEGDVLEEAGHRGVGVLEPVLAGDADELLQVFDPAARFDRALGLERLEDPGLLEHALEQLVDVELLRGGHER